MHTNIKMIVLRHNIFCKMLRHFLPVLVGNDSPVEGHAQLRLRATGINALLLIEILVVQCLADILSKLLVFLSIVQLAEQLCRLAQDERINVEINRSTEVAVGLCLHRNPVAQSPRRNVTVTPALHKVDQTPDGIVIVTKRTLIAIEHIELPGNNGGCRYPINANKEVVAPAARWDDVGKHTIRLLLIAVCTHPLLVCSNGIKVIECHLYGKVRIACPTILLAMRAICGITHEVREIGCTRSVHNLT